MSEQKQCKKCGQPFLSEHKVGVSSKTGKPYDFWTDTCRPCYAMKDAPFAAPQKPAAAAPAPANGTVADELEEIKKLQTELQECLRICTDLIRKRTI